jgi:hypothetical protein
MTKAELLAAFEAKPWVHSMIGEPKDVTPANEQPATVKWYEQPFFEQQKNCLIKRSDLRFYVLNEGGDEEAFYQSSEPKPTTQPNEFRDWISYQLALEGKGFSIMTASEEVDIAVVKVLETDPTDETQLVPVAYQCRRVDGALVKQKINVPTETVASISSI